MKEWKIKLAAWLKKYVELLGIIVCVVFWVALTGLVLVLLPIIGWAVAIIMTLVIIAVLTSFVAGWQSRK